MNANNNPQNNENPQNEPGWDEHVAEEDEKMEIKCSVCLEMVSESTVMRILEDIVCDDCITDAIVPQFEEAIKFEHKYPPTFGGVVLSFDKFSSYFDDPTFEARWSFRLLQYSIPHDGRAFCQHKIKKGAAPAPGDCGNLALDEIDIAQAELDGDGVEQCGAILHPLLMCKNSTCHSCSGRACRSCGAVSTKAKHTCKARTPEDPDAAIKAMGDLKRGRDWQQCPGCKAVHELAEACNWIRCFNKQCQIGYCFICGVAVTHDSGHWATGSSCPRFGQPGNKRAIFDEEEEPEEDDEDAEAGAEDEFAEDWAELNAVRHPAM